jgi:molybdopterin converting factor small subunit
MFAQTREVKGSVIILINDRNTAFLENMATTPVDGDIIALFLTIAGG